MSEKVDPKTAKRWPYLLPLAGLVLLATLFGKRLLDVEKGVDPLVIPTVLLDTPAPSFDLPPLPGHGDDLRSDALKGQVTLVNFFGSWCGTCVAEHPVLMEIAKSGEVPIEGVDWRDDPAKATAWLAKHGDPYDKIGQDPASHTAIDFGVAGAPETFLIDRNGVIRYKQDGEITEDVWRNTLRPLIAQLKK